MKNNATTPEKGSTIDSKQVNNKPKRCAFKIELCLFELLSRKEQGLAELEALNSYGDTCLHSTISTLSNKYNLIINRQSEPHQHQRGGKTFFVRYSLISLISIKQAFNLLNYYRERRNEKLFCKHSFYDEGVLIPSN